MTTLFIFLTTRIFYAVLKKILTPNVMLLVNTDQSEHTARSFSASLPLVQYTLSGKQSNPLICLIMKGYISKTVSMGHLCRQRPCHWLSFWDMKRILSSCSVHRNECTPWPCSMHYFIGIYTSMYMTHLAHILKRYSTVISVRIEFLNLINNFLSKTVKQTVFDVYYFMSIPYLNLH